MKGWFDAFRDDGAPTLYSFSNRTPVTGDVSVVAVCVTFATLYLAFLVIFPGVRKQKFSTYVTVTLSLFVGLVILVTRLGSGWHVAQTNILAPYKAFSREKLAGKLGAHIGLMHINVTLTALPIDNQTQPDIDFNERFKFEAANDMENCYKQALRRGLPYPILTVAEYFSLGQEGFSWGGQYRAAGYYASILLWASLASWLLMNLLLVAVPRYGAYMMTLTGLFLLGTAFGYYMMVPKRPLIIAIEGSRIFFHFGWCFWLVIVAGALSFSIGFIISIIDLIWPHRFTTILEVYYDTPYDRHVILEESHDVRYRKRNSKSGLEEPPSLGTRILRRLSSKANQLPTVNEQAAFDNRGFQNEVPKSPWRYPFGNNRRPFPPHMQRSVSQDSASSIGSYSQHNSVQLQSPPHNKSLHKMVTSRNLQKPPMNRMDETQITDLSGW
uniref:CSON006053 protein n=1 Tax=Culicoides sonorensis TaxID=179676 RepID=A0A336MSR9_CULSO